MSNKVGIITEQGDLGFGFDPLQKKDQKIYNESVKNSRNQNKSEKEKNDKKK